MQQSGGGIDSPPNDNIVLPGPHIYEESLSSSSSRVNSTNSSKIHYDYKSPEDHSVDEAFLRQVKL